MQVFAVLRAFGEGDGYTVFDLLGVTLTVDGARKLIAETKSVRTIRAVHPSMNAENGYTFVGRRDECSGECSYGRDGGFVIEPMGVLP